MKTERELQRIEAFSDGVFAIAATLLILEIKVPHLNDLNEQGGLWTGLKNQWPSLLAFTISFGTILVMWANHHQAMALVQKVSKPFLFGNGFLLLTVTFIPFPTAVLAEYIDSPQANVAVMFYSASYLFGNLGFNVWWQTMLRPVYLLNPEISEDRVKKLTIQTISGAIVYLFTTVLAYWFPVVSLIIIFALFILWVGMSMGQKDE